LIRTYLKTEICIYSHNIVEDIFNISDNCIIACHASPRVGGGYKGRGFVQEEGIVIKSLELPFLLARDAGFLKCSLLDVDVSRQALLIENELLFDEVCPAYGHEGLAKLDGMADKHYLPRNKPIKYFFMVKAIKDLSSSSTRYLDRNVISDAMEVCVSATLQAVMIGDVMRLSVINIGDSLWGCGAFGNNPNTIVLMLLLVWSIVLRIYTPKCRVIFNLHAPKGFNQIKIGYEFFESCRGKTHAACLDLLMEKHAMMDPVWFDKL
jgi:hypothetical protein